MGMEPTGVAKFKQGKITNKYLIVDILSYNYYTYKEAC